MKVHDQTSNFSLIDVQKGIASRGSANFIDTRLVSNDPTNFSKTDISNQFRINSSKGSLRQTQDLTGKSAINSSKKESRYLNQQR